MPSFKIRSWTHSMESTETRGFTASEDAGMPVLDRAESRVKETVFARFDVIDSEPVLKYRDSKMAQLPETIVIRMVSVDGAPWAKEKATAVAYNVKSDGSKGARNDLEDIHFPSWVKAFVGEWTFSKLEGYGASDWINTEYPRPER